MPFNTLLLTSLIHGTSFTDAGSTVRLKQQPDETILFFSIDNQSNRDGTLRQDLEMKPDEPICDLVVFYQGQKKVICLVELKSSELERAKEQIIHTYRQLQKSFTEAAKSKAYKSPLQQIQWKAYIYLRGSIPKEAKECQKDLKKIFVDKGAVEISRDEDIGKFLRQ